MSHNETICVIDDDSSIRWVLDKALGNAGLQVAAFDSADSALQAISKQEPAVIVTDIRMPGMDGLALLEHIHGRYPDLPVIIMTAHSDLDSAVSAYKGGAFEYLPKPFDVDEAVALVSRALELRAQKQVETRTAGTGGGTGNHRQGSRDAGSVSRHRPPGALQCHGIDQR